CRAAEWRQWAAARRRSNADEAVDPRPLHDRVRAQRNRPSRPARPGRRTAAEAVYAARPGAPGARSAGPQLVAQIVERCFEMTALGPAEHGPVAAGDRHAVQPAVRNLEFAHRVEARACREAARHFQHAAVREYEDRFAGMARGEVTEAFQ